MPLSSCWTQPPPTNASARIGDQFVNERLFSSRIAPHTIVRERRLSTARGIVVRRANVKDAFGFSLKRDATTLLRIGLTSRE